MAEQTIKIYKARLTRVVEQTETTKHFEWEVLSSEPFRFTPGQFISLTHEFEGKVHTRAYSIASPPRDANRIDLCLNRVPGGLFSNFLCDLAPGAVIQFEGPFGFFTLREPLERDAVFIATGTGIAPIRAMLDYLLHRGTDRQVWLIFGVRYPRSILYRDEFEELARPGGLARRHPNFHFIPTLSRPDESWQGATGHVQGHVQRLLAGRSDFEAYICGLKRMVDDMRAILKQMGLDRKAIRYEKYD